MISLGYAQLAKAPRRSSSLRCAAAAPTHTRHISIRRYICSYIQYIYTSYRVSNYVCVYVGLMYGAYFQQLRLVRSLPTLRCDVVWATESETHLPPQRDANPNPDKFSVRFTAYAFGHIAHILGFLSVLFVSFYFLLNIQNCEFCKNSKSKLLTLEHSKQAPSYTHVKKQLCGAPTQ